MEGGWEEEEDVVRSQNETDLKGEKGR